MSATTEYKVGAKIRVKNIPGVIISSFKTKPPFEAEIVGLSRDPKKQRVLIKIGPDIVTDSNYGWHFYENPTEFSVIAGSIVDQRVQYVTPSCFDVVDAKGKKEAKFKLEQQVKINDQFVRILGFNVQDQTYLVEAPDGEKLTHEMIKKMDLFVAYEAPDAKGNTNIKCKIVSEKDLLKVKENKMSEGNGSFVEMIKDDASETAYRVGARQMSKAVQAAVVRMMQDKGAKKAQIKAIQEFLSSELGEAFIKNALGYALTYAPMLKDDPRAVRLAKEFRVDGMAQVGNIAMEHVWPLLGHVMSNLQSLPAPEEAKPIERPVTKKIVHEEAVVEQEVVGATNNKQATA